MRIPDMTHVAEAPESSVAMGDTTQARDEDHAIAAAQAGDSAAIEQLVRTHWPAIHRAAYLIVRDAAAAEDVAQEAILSALQSLSRFRRGRRFGPWVRRIAVNRAIDWVRRRETRAETALTGHEPERRTDEMQSELGDHLITALGSLEAEQRALIVMRHVFDYQPHEIAQVLGIRAGAVRTRLHRAMATLRAELDPEEEEGSVQ